LFKKATIYLFLLIFFLLVGSVQAEEILEKPYIDPFQSIESNNINIKNNPKNLSPIEVEIKLEEKKLNKKVQKKEVPDINFFSFKGKVFYKEMKKVLLSFKDNTITVNNNEVFTYKTQRYRLVNYKGEYVLINMANPHLTKKLTTNNVEGVDYNVKIKK